MSTISSDRSASSTAGPNSTTQARVASDPTTIGLSTLLVIATEAGLGTVRDHTCIHKVRRKRENKRACILWCLNCNYMHADTVSCFRFGLVIGPRQYE